MSDVGPAAQYLPPVLKLRPGRRQFRPRRSFRCRSTLPCDASRPAGALVVLVAVQLSVPGLYLPPVFKGGPDRPPQTIISLPVQTAVCRLRPAGALVVLVAVQLSVLGLYLPPVFNSVNSTHPPQTIISLPVHTAV